MTDHRAKAEQWLTQAEENDESDSASVVAALVGIGHALLADPEPVSTTMTTPRIPAGNVWGGRSGDFT